MGLLLDVSFYFDGGSRSAPLRLRTDAQIAALPKNRQCSPVVHSTWGTRLRATTGLNGTIWSTNS